MHSIRSKIRRNQSFDSILEYFSLQLECLARIVHLSWFPSSSKVFSNHTPISLHIFPSRVHLNDFSIQLLIFGANKSITFPLIWFSFQSLKKFYHLCPILTCYGSFIYIWESNTITTYPRFHITWKESKKFFRILPFFYLWQLYISTMLKVRDEGIEIRRFPVLYSMKANNYLVNFDQLNWVSLRIRKCWNILWCSHRTRSLWHSIDGYVQ